jgi:hypothetical protein
MDIKTLSITELKALGFDQLTLLNQTQRNLALIEQELASRTPTETKEGE